LVQEVIRQRGVKIFRKFPFPLIESKTPLPRFCSRYEPRHRLAGPGDDNLFTGFNLFQELRKFGFGFVNIYQVRVRRIAN